MRVRPLRQPSGILRRFWLLPVALALCAGGWRWNALRDQVQGKGYTDETANWSKGLPAHRPARTSRSASTNVPGRSSPIWATADRPLDGIVVIGSSQRQPVRRLAPGRRLRSGHGTGGRGDRLDRRRLPLGPDQLGSAGNHSRRGGELADARRPGGNRQKPLELVHEPAAQSSTSWLSPCSRIARSGNWSFCRSWRALPKSCCFAA